MYQIGILWDALYDFHDNNEVLHPIENLSYRLLSQQLNALIKEEEERNSQLVNITSTPLFYYGQERNVLHKTTFSLKQNLQTISILEKQTDSTLIPNRFLCPNSFFYPEIHDGESKFVIHNNIYCSLCRNAIGKTNLYGVPILRDGNNYENISENISENDDFDRLEYTRSYVHLLWYCNVKEHSLVKVQKLFQCPTQRILMKIACYEQLLKLCLELNEIDHERFSNYNTRLREWTSIINCSSPNMIMNTCREIEDSVHRLIVEEFLQNSKRTDTFGLVRVSMNNDTVIGWGLRFNTNFNNPFIKSIGNFLTQNQKPTSSSSSTKTITTTSASTSGISFQFSGHAMNKSLQTQLIQDGYIYDRTPPGINSTTISTTKKSRKKPKTTTESTTLSPIDISEETKLQIWKEIKVLQEKHIFLSTTQIDNIIHQFATSSPSTSKLRQNIQGKTTCQIHAFLDLMNVLSSSVDSNAKDINRLKITILEKMRKVIKEFELKLEKETNNNTQTQIGTVLFLPTKQKTALTCSLLTSDINLPYFQTQLEIQFDQVELLYLLELIQEQEILRSMKFTPQLGNVLDLAKKLW